MIDRGEGVIRKSIFLCLTIVLICLLGCAGTKPMAGSEKVRVVFSREDILPGKHIGDVFGNCGSWWNSWALSYRYEYDNALNMIRNDALKKGGQQVWISDSITATWSIIFYGSTYTIDDKKQAATPAR